MNPGYVFIPYILVTTSVIVEGDMSLSKKINSKYIQTVASRFGTNPKIEKRIKKIKKILKKLEEFRDQSKSPSSHII